jgi:hypothetical protein
MPAEAPTVAIKRQLEKFIDSLDRQHPTALTDDIALPPQVAKVLDTTEAGLAQMRYRGTGPLFIKRGRRVLYRWSDVRAYLDENTCQRTDDPRGAAV